MPKGKATKKFEKNNLKDILERRNGLKKTKQKQQLKLKKKSRREEENGGPIEKKDAVPAEKEKDAFQDMGVDEFFQGGFDVPELPAKKNSKGSNANGKRKRKDDEAADAVSDDSDASEDSEDDEDHKQQLDALAENDPEFHKYLMENEPELLDASLADIGDLSASESEEEGDGPKRKKQKKAKGSAFDSEDEVEGNELDKATVAKWTKALSEQHSLRATKEVVLAFRAAAHVSDEEDKDFKYSISDPNVYHQLLTTALKHIPGVFENHLPVQEGKAGKLHVPTESKKFKTLAPLLRSQVSSIIHLLDHLSDPATLRLTLTSVIPLLPYMLSFKKVVRDLSRAVTAVWSSNANTEATRIAAFLVLRKLIVIGDAGIRENVLKSVYQGLIKGARMTTVHTIAGVNLMKNSAAELWGLADSGVAYTTGFTFIRQLAVHLRGSITNNSNESYKSVYNWQYVHSLDFWSRVLSAHAIEANSALRPLIYPLVQVSLGALRLIPTATYFPLRFQLIRGLLRLSRTTGTYIPLAPALYEVLNSAEMRKSPKQSTLKPLHFATSIRASKSYLRTRTYQDGIGEQVGELFSEFFVLWSKHIAFPELSLPVIVILKRWLKDVNNRTSGAGNNNSKVNNIIALLVQKLDATARFVEEKRAKVEFAPNDRRGVDNFLKDITWEKTPLGAYVVGQRKTREERAKMMEEAMKEDEKRKDEDKKKKGQEAVIVDDSMDEDSSDPEMEDDDEE